MKNWKKWKDGLFLVPAVIIAVGAVAGVQGNIPVFPKIPIIEDQVGDGNEKNTVDKIAQAAENAKEKTTVKEKKERSKKIRYRKKGRWKDGAYTGNGTGYGGMIRVKVMIKNGKITDIKIISHTNETPRYFSRAELLAERIVSEQDPNVSAVSGATFSSRGIMEAVVDALKKAGDDSQVTVKNTVKKSEKASEKKSESRTKRILKGQPADGVFSGSAVCERFGYTVHLKVRFRQGKTAALYGLRITGNSDPANAPFWEKAWRPVVKNILKKQKADVDAVSGATYSSGAIMEAYADAYTKAVAENNPSAQKTAAPTKRPKPTERPKPTGRPQMLEEEQEDTAKERKIKDGTYHVRAVCRPDEDCDFESYTLSADVTFLEEKCTAITNLSSNAESNQVFYKRAAEGKGHESGVVEQIIKKQSADGIYAVTGATCSSKTIRELYLLALAEASGESSQEAQSPSTQPPVTQPPVTQPPVTQPPVTQPPITPMPAETEEVLPEISSAPDASPASSGETPVPENAPEESIGENQMPEPEKNGLLKDGCYTVSVMVFPDEGEDFYEYILEADAVVSGGVFTDFENIGVQDSVNLWYCNRVLLGTESRLGILEQLVQKQSANAVDAVTGATCSSEAWMMLFQKMYQMAGVPTDDTQE